MGVLSLIIYTLILFFIIKRSYHVYLRSSNFIKQISFIVCCTKFGLLIPLLTANAELYLFVSLTTWFFAGYVESRYTELKFEKNKSLYWCFLLQNGTIRNQNIHWGTSTWIKKVWKQGCWIYFFLWYRKVKKQTIFYQFKIQIG